MRTRNRSADVVAPQRVGRRPSGEPIVSSRRPLAMMSSRSWSGRSSTHPVTGQRLPSWAVPLSTAGRCGPLAAAGVVRRRSPWARHAWGPGSRRRPGAPRRARCPRGWRRRRSHVRPGWRRSCCRSGRAQPRPRVGALGEFARATRSAESRSPCRARTLGRERFCGAGDEAFATGQWGRRGPAGSTAALSAPTARTRRRRPLRRRTAPCPGFRGWHGRVIGFPPTGVAGRTPRAPTHTPGCAATAPATAARPSRAHMAPPTSPPRWTSGTPSGSRSTPGTRAA